jgi:hypothetical protein
VRRRQLRRTIPKVLSLKLLKGSHSDPTERQLNKLNHCIKKRRGGDQGEMCVCVCVCVCVIA